MRKLAVAVATIVLIVAPVSSADAKPKHHGHDKPVVSRVIDWD